MDKNDFEENATENWIVYHVYVVIVSRDIL